MSHARLATSRTSGSERCDVELKIDIAIEQSPIIHEGVTESSEQMKRGYHQTKWWTLLQVHTMTRLVFVTSAFPTALCRRGGLLVKAGRETNFQTRAVPPVPTPHLCLGVGWASKILPTWARGNLDHKMLRINFSKLSHTLAAYCMMDGSFFDQLLDPARFAVGSHAAQPSVILCRSGAQHKVPGCASVARLVERCDVAVDSQVRARRSKGFQRALGPEVPDWPVVDVEMRLSDVQHVVRLLLEEPLQCCADCAIQHHSLVAATALGGHLFLQRAHDQHMVGGPRDAAFRIDDIFWIHP